MPVITRAQCGDLLSMWLGNASSPANLKQVVKDTGYNDSPFFGAEKKKTKIMGELVIANSALAIFAVNQVFGQADSKTIIDKFLTASRKSIFGFLESRDPTFKTRYEQRMGQYFAIFADDNPSLGISFAFLQNIDLDPLKHLQGQLLVAARFGDSLTQSLNVLKTFTLMPGGA